MGHQNFRGFGYFGRVFRLISLGLAPVLLLPSFADANNDLLLKYKFYRVDDDINPRLFYRIVPSEFSLEFQKQGVDYFPNAQSTVIYDCNDQITQIDVTQLIETVERCEDKVGGPLEFKTINIGETFAIEGWDPETTLSATWNGLNFDVNGVFDDLSDPEIKALIAEISETARWITIEQKMNDVKFPSGFSIKAGATTFDYIETDKHGGVALQIDWPNDLSQIR